MQGSFWIALWVENMIKKPCGMLVFRIWGIEYKIMHQLYKTLAKHQLVSCMQFFSPDYRGNMIMLEREQQRITKLLPGMTRVMRYIK